MAVHRSQETALRDHAQELVDHLATAREPRWHRGAGAPRGTATQLLSQAARSGSARTLCLAGKARALLLQPHRRHLAHRSTARPAKPEARVLRSRPLARTADGL